MLSEAVMEPPVLPEAVIGIKGGRFQILKPQLAFGGGGTIYKCQNEAGDILAIKISFVSRDYTFMSEIRILKAAKKSEGALYFPTIYDFGSLGDQVPYVVMDLLGKDLLELLPIPGYSTRTMAFIVGETIEGLRHLHSLGYTHGDLKLSNMAISLTNPRSIKLLDFGHSYPYRNDDGTHKPEERVRFGNQGTRSYMSIRQSFGFLGTRRDDLEAWFYTMTAAHVGLPWTPRDDSYRMLTMKEEANKLDGDEFESLPTFLQKLLQIIKPVGVFADPPYDDLKNVVNEVVQEAGLAALPLDWEPKP